MKTLTAMAMAIAGAAPALAQSPAFPTWDIAVFCRDNPTSYAPDVCLYNYNGWRYAAGLEWQRATPVDRKRCVAKENWKDYEAFYWCVAENDSGAPYPKRADGTYLPLEK
jgi:hypothetical protein